MAFPLRYDYEQYRAQNTPTMVVSLAIGAALMCAIELSSWGRRTFDIQAWPVVVVSGLWIVHVCVQGWLLDRRAAIPKWFFVLGILAQQALCAVHGAASNQVASPAYCLGPLGVVVVAALYRPERWLFVLVAAVPPLLRLALFPEVGAGLLVALSVGVANLVVFGAAAASEEARRPLIEGTKTDVAWAEALRARPGFEVAMFLHDSTSGAVLKLQDEVQRATSTAALVPLVRNIELDLGGALERPGMSSYAELEAAVSALAERYHVAIAFVVQAPHLYASLPSALRDDLAAVIREGLANAARHTDTQDGIRLELVLSHASVVCSVRSGAERKGASSGAKRGLRNLRLRASTWSGTASLEVTATSSQLVVSMNRVALPSIWRAMVGLIGFGAMLALSIAAGASRSGIAIAGFLLGYWIFLIVGTERGIRQLMERAESARAARQSIEASIAEHASARLAGPLEALAHAVSNDDLMQLRRAADVLAEELSDVLTSLENQAPAE